MLGLLYSQPFLFLLAALSLLIVITIHEFAHAFMADKLGDPTPRLQGRLTLNPLAHLDPLGTIGILLVGFGWGKPVQFDPFNLQNHRRDTALISLAGPFSNLVLASLCSILLRSIASLSFDGAGLISAFLIILIEYNIALAVFNLLPIHPLDGGKILAGLLPPHLAHQFDLFMHQYGLIILIFLLLPLTGSPLIHTFLSPLISFFKQIYLPASLFSHTTITQILPFPATI